MPLSDLACKNAHKHTKATEGKPFKLFDERGLYLLVTPNAKKIHPWALDSGNPPAVHAGAGSAGMTILEKMIM
jgi:hypothetical protein